MKSIKTKILLLVPLLSACEAFVTGVDEVNPIAVTNVELSQAMIGAELNYMATLEGPYATLSGVWCGHFNYSAPNSVADLYQVTPEDNYWTQVYSNTLRHLRIAREKAREMDNTSGAGICEVLEASLMTTAAALWGDIPYSQAVQHDKYPYPKYDRQNEIMNSLLVLLDNAIVNLNNNQKPVGDFFGKSNVQWTAVAYSIKARILLYQKKYGEAIIAANSGIQLYTNDFGARHGTTAGVDQNLFYRQALLGSIHANNTLLGHLLTASSASSRDHVRTNESARRAKYYSGSSPGNYTVNNTSTGFFSQSAATPFHTAAETKLIAAECHLRLGDFQNALVELNGHRANLRAQYPTGTYSDFVASDFDAGQIENPGGTLTPAEALLKEIHEEKYVCLYGQIELFNEVRRTGNAIGLTPVVGNMLPQRFLYSLTEITTNKNVPQPLPDLFEKTDLFK